MVLGFVTKKYDCTMKPFLLNNYLDEKIVFLIGPKKHGSVVSFEVKKVHLGYAAGHLNTQSLRCHSYNHILIIIFFTITRVEAGNAAVSLHLFLICLTITKHISFFLSSIVKRKIKNSTFSTIFN